MEGLFPVMLACFEGRAGIKGNKKGTTEVPFNIR